MFACLLLIIIEQDDKEVLRKSRGCPDLLTKRKYLMRSAFSKVYKIYENKHDCLSKSLSGEHLGLKHSV